MNKKKIIKALLTVEILLIALCMSGWNVMMSTLFICMAAVLQRCVKMQTAQRWRADYWWHPSGGSLISLWCRAGEVVCNDFWKRCDLFHFRCSRCHSRCTACADTSHSGGDWRKRYNWNIQFFTVGCAEVEITWGSEPVELVEAIMQAAGLR